MAQLAKEPKDWQLEDLVAAHFVSRGCFVECGITERDPGGDILELDVVWTDYRAAVLQPKPVEVKSSKWGLADIFKFYGWTRYLGLPAGQFAYSVQPGEKDLLKIRTVCKRTNIGLLHVPPQPQAVSESFEALHLPPSSMGHLPELWRFSYWARRRLFESLQEAIRQNTCPTSAKKAKEYRQLINDVLFFEPDPRDRLVMLVGAHQSHPRLAKAAAAELDRLPIDFDDPPETSTFRDALFYGRHFPVQACLYNAHRARLYVLKAAVDYWMSQGSSAKADSHVDMRLTAACVSALRKFSRFEWFSLLPVFWQVLLWGWGGFILDYRSGEEYEALSQQTGIPKEDIPVALTAFDHFFPMAGGWWRQVPAARRRVLILMPAAMRGVGAFHRQKLYGVERYRNISYSSYTEKHLRGDHNVGARLLECSKEELAK